MRCKKGRPEGTTLHAKFRVPIIKTAILLEYKTVYVEIAQRWHAAAQFCLEVGWLSC